MKIDGLLYVLIAFFGALAGFFNTDEAAKFINPEMLFWLRGFCTVNAAWILALKMFRSTSFADHAAAVARDSIEPAHDSAPQIAPPK